MLRIYLLVDSRDLGSYRCRVEEVMYTSAWKPQKRRLPLLRTFALTRLNLDILKRSLGSHTMLQYPGDLKVNLWEYIGVIVLRKKGIQGHLLYHSDEIVL